MITSLSNTRIKYIRKLKDKKFREASGVFFAEGVRVVGEAFEEGWEFEQAVICESLFRDDYSRSLVEAFEEINIDMLRVDEKVFKSLTTKEGPKGIGAVIKQRWCDVDLMTHEAGLFIALDRVQDHGNLGTIMRKADAVGVKGIYLLDHSTDPYDTKTIKASMGAIFNLSLVRCDSQKFMNIVKSNAIFTAGTSDKGAKDYQEVSYPEKMVLLMGSEREGLSEFLMANCDALIRIPMQGKSDSLNLAVATAVSLYEIFNQNRKRA